MYGYEPLFFLHFKPAIYFWLGRDTELSVRLNAATCVSARAINYTTDRMRQSDKTSFSNSSVCVDEPRMFAHTSPLANKAAARVRPAIWGRDSAASFAAPEPTRQRGA